MDRHVYAVYSAGEKWNMALNGNVIGTFARPRDALKVAVFCARVSGRIGHETEVLTRSASEKTRVIWSQDHRGVGAR
jgi:hypothetical protein